VLFLSCSHPFFYFPVFYSMKGYVEGRSASEIYDKYRADLWENCKALWTIWVPAQLVNFSVVPRHLRIPFGKPAACQPAHQAALHPCSSARQSAVCSAVPQLVCTAGKLPGMLVGHMC
jgi:hypothetical protein